MTTRLASLPDDGRNPLTMFFKRMVLASLLLLGAAATGANAASHAAPSDKEIVDAWTYLYGRYLVVQQENHDINVEKVGYNKIKYNPLGSAQFVNPNLDVAYLEAWLAVDKDHAVILNVPRVEGRYYTAQLLDGWGEVIVNINERTFPKKPYGKYALVLKGSNPPIPADAQRIELPAAKAKMLARVELKGTPDEAQKLQKEFTLDVPAGINIEPPPVIAEFTPAVPIGAAMFDNVTTVLASYPDAMPKAAAYQRLALKVGEYVQKGSTERDRVETVIRKQAIPNFLSSVKGFGKQKGGWSVTYASGKFGNDTYARDIINYGGLWANTVSEALYFIGQTDSKKQALNGSNNYEIRFPKGGMPDTQVNAFWSLTLYSVPDYRVVANDLKRYNINNQSKLQPNADGSTSIWLGPNKPKDGFESNWLPTPEGKGFSLNFRMYVAKQDVLSGKWFPPPIQLLK